MKKILIVVAGLVVLAVVGAVVLLTNLDSIIARAIRGFGSDATQTKVSLDSASVSLTDGTGTLKGLSIGNPKGYEAPAAFDLGEVRVQVDPGSVRSETIVIREVGIIGPKITYELDKSLQSNLAKIQSNVEAYAQRFGGGGEKAESASKSSQKVRIERFHVEGGSVSLVTPVPGQGLTVPLPAFEMKNLGGSDGETFEQMTATLLETLTQKAISTALDAGLEKKARGLLDGAVDRATDALGGLLGGKDEPEPKKKKPRGK